MGSAWKGRKRFVHAAILICGAAFAASAQQTGDTGSPPAGPQVAKPQSPETAPKAVDTSGSPVPAVAQIGPAREIKLGEYTWFRFGAQVQAWVKVAQDRILQPDGSSGGYGYDIYCRRCRIFTTGSVVKNVYFNLLLEASNLGQTQATGFKNGFAGSTNPVAAPSLLDGYGQVKFADWFWLSGGSILMPLTRNGLQPTTTYVSLDNAFVDTTPVLQGNTLVLRDLGIQANGFFAANHVEYRVGAFQGSRQPSSATQGPGHNAPRFVTMLSVNFWDPETGYVNGGHYYGTRKVVGVMGNFDYQVFRKNAPGLPPPGSTTNQPGGTDKNAYYGLSGAVFLNYPLAGPSPKGGDEIVGLLQAGFYDGGFAQSATGAPTNPGTYPSVLKQTNFLAEAGYYNHASHFSVFGKFEKRKISDDFVTALKASSNQTWIAGGFKYFVAPANFMNFTLQFERINNDDAPSTQQGGTNNLTFAMQVILY